MGDALTILVAGLTGAAAAVLLGWAMRHRETEPEDVTLGFLGPSLAALYLLVLALAVAAEWGTISDAHQSATTEASALHQLYWSAAGLPAAAGAELRAEVREYATAVVTRDWPQMARGTLDDRTEEMLGAMKQTVLRVNPPDAAASAAQTDSLNQLTTLSAVRAQREDDAGVKLPSGLLAGVIATSVVVALFPFAVGIRPVLPSVVLASMQAALVAIGVVVIFQLNHAYSGPLAVQPAPIRALVQQIGTP
ncbi:MAG: DUF4239 domain-containing protein [Streptosporangiaceae bacterium]|nr:DUF4239 domain-containing protein [Streptosporangiaceae bacterium]